MEVGKTFVSIGANTAPLAAGLTQAKGMTAKATATMTAKLAGIGKGMTIAGAIIVASFGLAIKTAKKFEQSMANTASVAGATAEELKKLSDYARKMGEQSVFSASQAADGMYFLASAGMNTNEIMGALEGTLALAAATASDLAYTSESVAATLSQFGFAAEEAGRVSNVFAAAISGSQATMEKMTNSMSYVGPMAKSMGMTLETTTGILMNLYNAGLQGSKAGTALRMAFVKLIDPTTKGADALERLRVVIKDSSGELRPFEDIINELGIAGMSTADAMDIFGIRAGPAMMALVSQGTGAIQKMTEAVTDTNKATEMAAMQIDTFEGAMKLLRSAFEELQITLVQELLPNLKGLIERITEGIKKVTAWMKENPKLTESIVKWSAAIGALMIVLGPLLIILPGLVTAFTGVKVAIIAVGATSKAVIPFINNLKVSLNTLGGIALLAGANIIIWSEVWKEWQKIANSVHTTQNDVNDGFQILADAQLVTAEKMGITVREFVKLQKEGKSVTEMMDPLISKYDEFSGALGVWTIKALEQEVGAKLIVTTVKDLTQEMNLLTKEYGASSQVINESITYYNNMIDLLNRTDIILQTELTLLEKGTEEYSKKKEKIADNTKALNEMNQALAKLTEPLEGLELIVAKMAALGDSTEDTKVKIELLNEKAVLLQKALEEAIPDTEAWWKAKVAFEENQTAISGLTVKLNELTEKELEAIEAAKTLADAYKTITDKIYELTHTSLENTIYKLDQQKQAYIDLGVEIRIVNKWYDAEIAKLTEVGQALDKHTEKLKRTTESTSITASQLNEAFSEVTKKINVATQALSDFTKEGLIAAIITVKMKFLPLIYDLRDAMAKTKEMFFLGQLTLVNYTNLMAYYSKQLSGVYKEQNKQISILKYGLEEYNRLISGLSGGAGGGSVWGGGGVATTTPTTPTGSAPTTPTTPTSSAPTTPSWGSIGSYKMGTDYVPRTGLYQLHRGEAVIPANQITNNTFSPTVNMTVSGEENAQNIAYEVKKVLGDMSVDFRRG